MIDGVKSLGSVEKKKDATDLLHHSLVKELVDSDYMLGAVSSSQKTSLRGLD